MPSHQAHINITLATIDDLRSFLPSDLIKGILKGVIDPDRAPDITSKMSYI